MAQAANSTALENGRPARRVRSKNGCLTCKRRRVRCNEVHPRCNHCERLHLRCTWRTLNGFQDDSQEDSSHITTGPVDMFQPATFESAFDVLDSWDFNDLVWQDTSALAQGATQWPSLDEARSTALTGETEAMHRSPYQNESVEMATMSAHSNASPAASSDHGGLLLDNFLSSVAPPILASVEIGPRWTSAKALFASLAASSDMVRYAVIAFSALQIGDRDGTVRHKHKLLCERAARYLTTFMALAGREPDRAKDQLHHALATIFFLSYAALLTSRVDEAQQLLRDGASLVRSFKTKDFSLVEKRLISWIRLVDGRASSAGGDGVFLAETDGDVYAPEAHQKPLMGESGIDNVTFNVDEQIQETLFDILHSPGLVFYQQVQSIMARVSNIDPWHRSRGTVADETEVMAIAQNIRKSLIALERQRPALTDHAVAGTLTDTHIAKDIADALVRSYRTYWANYEAAYIHLHRVAHKHLPATSEVLRARTTIKDIARALARSDQAMPVNSIWPLLMACCEEDNLDDRAWMIATIRDMQSAASNAKPIADVLEEVHRRQDLTKSRVDVRQVSIDLFNLSFAVV